MRKSRCNAVIIEISREIISLKAGSFSSSAVHPGLIRDFGKASQFIIGVTSNSIARFFVALSGFSRKFCRIGVSFFDATCNNRRHTGVQGLAGVGR